MTKMKRQGRNVKEVSRYFELIRRGENVPVAPAPEEGSRALRPLPVAPVVPGEVARAGAIRRLNERIAPLANVGGAVRLLVSGCRPGDGASSVAAGVAIDLSQR